MKIQAFRNTSIAKPNFQGLHVIDTDVQKLLLKSLTAKQLEELSACLKEQQNNSIHILLVSKNGKKLEASLMCAYRLQDFKTKYKQRFLFESKSHFIKRVVNKANEYKKQIQNFKVLKLNWNYSMSSEWVTKMNL